MKIHLELTLVFLIGPLVDGKALPPPLILGDCSCSCSSGDASFFCNIACAFDILLKSVFLTKLSLHNTKGDLKER